MNIQKLETRFSEGIDTEMGNIVDMVENRTQNEMLTEIDIIITHSIEIVVRSFTESFGRDAAIFGLMSERGECIGITASFKNVSKRNNVFRELNANDDTRGKIQDNVSELPVSGTYFDRQSHSPYRHFF